MFNIGSGEMIALAILALLVFGPEGLPEMAKKVARTLKALRQAATDFQYEVDQALEIESQRQQAQRRRRKVEPESNPSSTIATSEGAATADALDDDAIEEIADRPDTGKALDDEVKNTPETAAGPSPESSLNDSELAVNRDKEMIYLESKTSTSPLGEDSSDTKTLAMTGDAPIPERDPLGDDDDGPGLPMGRISVIQSSSATSSKLEPQLEPMS